jgi:hypothetical protein
MRHRRAKVLLNAAVIVILICASGTTQTAESPASPKPAYLYRATFVRAAPGRLLDLIGLYKSRMPVFGLAGDEPPFWWRHTQGDQWDLMLLFPMGSYAEYYAKARVARRAGAGGTGVPSLEELARSLDGCSSWREDVFVFGPPLEVVKKAFEGTAYYHIEIFIALPGKQLELFRERQMENAYQVAIGRPENMVFVRDQGAAWDLFSLGCYRDIRHWAESGDVPKDEREAAARRAGFRGADDIGPYMRTLIDMHRDTMGVAIK